MLPEQKNLNSAQPSTALDANQLQQLQQLTNGYSPLQLAWASGYLAAKSEISPVASAVSAATQPVVSSILTILFASQTGNAKGVASKLADAAKQAGITVNLKNVADYKPKSLKSETHLLIVASTNGEGEPPDDALEFHEFLHGKKAPKLANLKYSVLALGDSSYEFFCQTGKEFDERLAALGATQVSARVDCDVDYDVDAKTWSNDIVEHLKGELTAESQELAQVVSLVSATAPAGAASLYSKQNPYAAQLLVSQKITGRDSAKDVRHIEIDLGESGLTYQAGDALGVYFDNDSALVDELLNVLSLTGEEEVSLVKGEQTLSLPLKAALISELEITLTAPNFIDFWAKISESQTLADIASDKNSARKYAANHQIVDIVKSAPAVIAAQDFVDALRKLTPRLYSIASSQAEVEEEVHLTVGLVSYDNEGQTRTGGASGFLAQRLEEGGDVKVFIEHNDNFRLPQNPETPVIMIGPGTGVAPFRAFMQEREANDATGDNWMFFGDQTFAQDFLYQVEWQNYLKSGLLTKLDVAFSRDQAEKIYVQDRLKENAQDVFAWLESGAHLYICGDANRMAKDVHQALVDIVIEQGQKTEEQAEDYLKSLRSAKRYQKDVY
ncbi:assimilatory sulfite reductase (NADPH) flavoprotein subunit [Thalassotalea atypica]|uniref:assimilatory sulfite reductase (NADPH) flavoprotein subunit n=1 Tax=Thalassotalea atypica TaxID=2054316 RepID=UPI0025740893|nr:assimilatory sulfite reductase (NADPH) flavoprotein subunit [Thalassotalea atypica]